MSSTKNLVITLYGRVYHLSGLAEAIVQRQSQFGHILILVYVVFALTIVAESTHFPLIAYARRLETYQNHRIVVWVHDQDICFKEASSRGLFPSMRTFQQERMLVVNGVLLSTLCQDDGLLSREQRIQFRGEINFRALVNRVPPSILHREDDESPSGVISESYVNASTLRRDDESISCERGIPFSREYGIPVKFIWPALKVEFKAKIYGALLWGFDDEADTKCCPSPSDFFML
ncbi:hypothetical protein EDD85DRAFT_794155 [Armillaria nabsnona]|nr:hypothetical protein EDD85DRAFT_794155 [Armillaria nabsnona]